MLQVRSGTTLQEPRPGRSVANGRGIWRTSPQIRHDPSSILALSSPAKETVREGGRAKQRIVKNLGRKDAVTASGALERLATSVARYAERAIVLTQIEAGNPDGLACKRIGAPLLFGRLWEETGCRAVIEDLLDDRSFEFALERAVFATVLHRIMVSGSDRACEKWLGDYDISGVDGLGLHHLYRAMAWLGEELPADEQDGATPFAPRTVKDLIEEERFARRRDL